MADPSTLPGADVPKTASWHACVLGPLRISLADGSTVDLGGPQQRLVLALLLASAPDPRFTDQLIDDVWPVDPPVTARKTIQVHVARLRGALGSEGPVQSVPRGYRVLPDRVRTDAVEFEHLVRDNSAAEGEPRAAAARYRRALDLWAGLPYGDVPDAELLVRERVRLADLRLVALERRVEADLALARHVELVGELEALVAEHPYRERFVALLVLAHYRSGRQADALDVVRRARERLVDELGIEPGAELRSLERRVLNQDPTLWPRTSPSEFPIVRGATSTPDDTSGPGRAVRGYELRDEVARAGQVVSYRGYQAGMAREVSVSVAAPALASDPDFIRRFDRFAQQIAALQHPNIVPVLDHWRDPEGAYVVTAWLGEDWDPTASRTEILRRVAQVGLALAHCHRRGVVHGAVEPAAVRLDEEGNAYLGGFDILGRAVDGRLASADRQGGPAFAASAPPDRAGDVVGLARLADPLVEKVGGHGDEPVIDDRRWQSVAARVRRVLEASAAPREDRPDVFVRDLLAAAGADPARIVGVPAPSLDEIRNPFKGLRAFGRADADDFHGREALVEHLVTATEARRFVAVVGPSGCGKSSLVRAGLLPALAERPLLATEMVPGDQPFDELANALLRVATTRPSSLLAELRADDGGLARVVRRVVPDGHEVLLIVDQFEELFTLVEDAPTRRAFMAAVVAALAAPDTRLRVVITVRADFFHRPLEHPSFGELVRQGVLAVTLPTHDELRRMVTEPAAAVGLRLEPGLAATIADEVEGRPGGLPLLQYALTELVRTRTSNSLTHGDHARIGGVTGALGRRAEQLYTDLDDDLREVASQVFLRLVTAGSGADDVRRRVRVRDLRSLDLDRRAVDAVLEVFGRERLLSFDAEAVTRAPTVEVAHEALFRTWDRLRVLVDGRREDLLLRRRLSAAVDDWQRAAGDASYLARGGRLELYEAHVASSGLTLTDVERDFLEASRRRRAAERRAAAERRRQEVVTTLRLRRRLAIVAVASVLAVLAGSVAVVQGRRAGTAAVVADARRVGAQALAATDVDRALLLAVAAVRLDDSADTRATLLTALGRVPDLAGVLRPAEGRVLGQVSVSDDGRTGAVYDDGHRLHFFDVRTHRVVAAYQPSDDVDGIAFLNTGRATFHPADGPVAVGITTLGFNPVRFLDPDTFTELPDQLGGFPSPNMLPWDIEYSPDGRLLAVAFDVYPDRRYPAAGSSAVVVWDVASPGEPLLVLDDIRPFTHGVAFGPDGRELFTATHAVPPLFETDPTVVVYDTTTGRLTRALDVPSYPLAVSPDGSLIATASAAAALAGRTSRTDVLVHDAATGRLVQRLQGHTGGVTDLTFSDDGSQLLSAGSDRVVAIWDVETGAQVDRLSGHAGEVASVAVAPDAGLVLSAGLDGAVMLWDRGGAQRFVTTRAVAGELLPRGSIGLTDDRWAVSPTGESVLTVLTLASEEELGEAEAFLQVIDAVTGVPGPLVEAGHGDTVVAAWHPSGERFATAGGDGVVRSWDAATSSKVAERQVMGGRITGITYVDDGDSLLVASLSGTRMLTLDATTLEPRPDDFTIAAGWLALIYSEPSVDLVAMVTGDPRVDVSGNEDQIDDRLLLIDPATGDVRRELALGFDGEYADVAPDGTAVAVTGDAGQIALVDTSEGRFVRPPVQAHDGRLTSIDYSPDGALVASGGWDGRVGLWDGHTGDLLGLVRVTDADTPAYVSFTTDGASVVASTRDDRLHVIDARPEQWIEHACAVAGRELTPVEWADAFGDRPQELTCDDA